MSKSASAKLRPVCKPRFRVMLGDCIALGPGKIDLLEAIAKTGSLSAAAKSLGLSYRRAWGLLETMNTCFKENLVDCTTGGKGGGGAALTPAGKDVVRLYRDMEAKAQKSAGKEWAAIRALLRDSAP